MLGISDSIVNGAIISCCIASVSYSIAATGASIVTVRFWISNSIIVTIPSSNCGVCITSVSNGVCITSVSNGVCSCPSVDSVIGGGSTVITSRIWISNSIINNISSSILSINGCGGRLSFNNRTDGHWRDHNILGCSSICWESIICHNITSIYTCISTSIYRLSLSSSREGVKCLRL